jgi:hypothetical protein
MVYEAIVALEVLYLTACWAAQSSWPWPPASSLWYWAGAAYRGRWWVRVCWRLPVVLRVLAPTSILVWAVLFRVYRWLPPVWVLAATLGGFVGTAIYVLDEKGRSANAGE